MSNARRLLLIDDDPSHTAVFQDPVRKAMGGSSGWEWVRDACQKSRTTKTQRNLGCFF
jgi:hypothetical protein